jgi:ribonuclease-3
MDKLLELSKIIGVNFTDQSLLMKALTHKSYAINNNIESYERLEFLGDSLLQMIVSEYIFKNFPHYNEGEMTKLRAEVVNSISLVECTRYWNIIEFMLLSDGEGQSNRRTSKKMQADVAEAIIAAIYLDAGYITCRDFILKNFKKKIDETSLDTLPDYKTRLQELYQQNGSEAPVYKTINLSGPEHDRFFEVAVFFAGDELARGVGKSKKEAHQNAAKKVLEESLKGD